MTSYAAVKGRAAIPVAAAEDAEVGKSNGPAALTPKQEAEIDENKAFVMEHMPELKPFILGLYAEGYIDGWRAVKNCRLIERG